MAVVVEVAVAVAVNIGRAEGRGGGQGGGRPAGARPSLLRGDRLAEARTVYSTLYSTYCTVSVQHVDHHGPKEM